MTDQLEQQLRQALKDQAMDAPQPGDLAGIARRRAHTQRSRVATAGGAALAVAAASVGIALLSPSGTATQPVTPVAGSTSPATPSAGLGSRNALSGGAASAAPTTAPKQPSGSALQSSTPGPATRAGISPAALVGFWRVRAAGEPSGTLLRLGEGLALTRSCGLLTGSWRAGGRDLFIGHLGGSTVGCEAAALAEPRWLRQAERARPVVGGWQLSTPDGRVVATLIRATPTPVASPAGSRWPAEFFTPPTAPPPAPQVATPALPVPKGPPGLLGERRPAFPASLVGRWVPVGAEGRQSTGRAYLSLAAGGDWKGSDGCNTSTGRWTADEDGQLIAVSGGQSMMGCLDQVPTSSWLTSATRAMFTYRNLILLTADDRADERAIGWLTPSS